mgnify:CR=1 FL=1
MSTSKTKLPPEAQEVIDYVTGPELGKKLSKATHEVEEFVKEHPIASIALAAGVGYLVARLLNRNNS